MMANEMVRSTLRFDFEKEDHRRAYGHMKALHSGDFSNLTNYVVAAVLAFEHDDGKQKEEISDEACKKIARFVREEMKAVQNYSNGSVRRYGV